MRFLRYEVWPKTLQDDRLADFGPLSSLRHGWPHENQTETTLDQGIDLLSPIANNLSSDSPKSSIDDESRQVFSAKNRGASKSLVDNDTELSDEHDIALMRGPIENRDPDLTRQSTVSEWSGQPSSQTSDRQQRITLHENIDISHHKVNDINSEPQEFE